MGALFSYFLFPLEDVILTYYVTYLFFASSLAGLMMAEWWFYNPSAAVSKRVVPCFEASVPDVLWLCLFVT